MYITLQVPNATCTPYPYPYPCVMDNYLHGSGYRLAFGYLQVYLCQCLAAAVSDTLEKKLDSFSVTQE